ncbi:MAG: FAD-binding oxidoreductase [Nocardioidaceae bacterium]
MSETMSPTPTATGETPVADPDPGRSTPLRHLRRRVAGRLHVPGDPSWAAASTPWLVNIEQHPMAVLQVRDADDVIAAVRWADSHGVQVTAQPTGHGANDTLDDVLLLRTRALADIDVDVRRRTAWVGAGVKAGELLAALDGTGLTFLAGSNPDPTVVGMTVTGGISWFGRRYGLGSDSIVTIELVDGLGRLRRVDASEDPELFWALRGGGGAFGIITRMEVALHPAPQLFGGRLLWPVARTAEVLCAFADVTAAAPEELTVWFHAYRFPPLPEVPEAVRGQAFASVAVAFLGPRAEAEVLLAPFRAIPDLALDLLGDVPLARLGGVADEPTEPMPGMQRSHLLTRLDERTVDALVASVGPDTGFPLPIVQVRHLGGAFAREDREPGAHGPVTEDYTLFALGVPVAPQQEEAIRSRFDEISSAVAPVASGRTLLNFLEAGEDPGRWWASETRARLQLAKRESDPLGTIRSNRPVGR